MVPAEVLGVRCRKMSCSQGPPPGQLQRQACLTQGSFCTQGSAENNVLPLTTPCYSWLMIGKLRRRAVQEPAPITAMQSSHSRLSARPFAPPVFSVASLPSLDGPMRPDMFCECSLVPKEGEILQALASHLPGPPVIAAASSVLSHGEALGNELLPVAPVQGREKRLTQGPPRGTRHRPCWSHPAS